MITYDYKFLYMILNIYIYICLCVSNHPVFFLSKTNTLDLGWGSFGSCGSSHLVVAPPNKKLVYKLYINPNELTASVCVCIYIYIYISTMNPFAIKNQLSILIFHHVSWNLFFFQFLISSWWGRCPRAFIIFIPLGISSIFHHITLRPNIWKKRLPFTPQILHLQLAIRAEHLGAASKSVA